MNPPVLAAACVFLMFGAAVIGRRPLLIIPRRFDTAPRRRHRWRLRRAMPIAWVIAAMVIGGPFTAGAAVGVMLLWSRTRPVFAQRRHRASVERALPETLDVLVLAVRAGLTPQQAIGELARHAPEPTRPAFATVVHLCDRGQPFPEALQALPDALGPRATAVAEVIAASERYGLPLGHVLDQLSSEARDARRRIDQADARKLPVRLSFPLVACTLPSFVLLAIAPAVIAALSSLGGFAW